MISAPWSLMQDFLTIASGVFFHVYNSFDSHQMLMMFCVKGHEKVHELKIS